MTIAFVKINTHTGNGAEVWMTSRPEEMVKKFGDFEKESLVS